MRKEKYIVEKKHKGYVVYEINFRYTDLMGLEKSYSKSFNSKKYGSPKEALKEAVKVRDKVRGEIATIGKAKTKKTLKEVYRETKELFPQSPETFRKYDMTFNKFMSRLENKNIDTITSKDIILSLNKATSHSQYTINRLFCLYRKIFKCALISNYISVNPCDRVVVPKSKVVITPKPVVMECSLKEVIEALKEDAGTSENTRYNNQLIIYAILVINFLGLRPSECYALTKDDIDFSKREITINKAVGLDENRKPCIKATKNQSSVRKLPISEELFFVLLELFDFQKNNQLFMGYSELLSSSYVCDKIRHAMKKKGLKFNMYMLRHKFSTELLKNGVDIRTIMELMGHTNSSMSIEYARSDDERKNEAINLIK